MADRILILSAAVSDIEQQYRAPEEDVLSATTDEYTETHRNFNYGYRSSSNSDDYADDDEEDEEDPYQELFMNAYRSAPQSSDDEETEIDVKGCTNPAAKPLCLMEDWDLWDYMDESELKERLKDHPKLLEEITRKRKRRMQEEEDAATALEDDELCNVMNRAVKCIRSEPSQLTS
ncbi:uncharacterized protein LOC128712498 [Anopheles marshallii]|uniref:uncharacterized protein LOC128712498 n=1 Tax=Anopheles marshallii TaxID=1521116 RepID=UPI00237BF6E8|nr:uncharacterized protein LOC128712498 [Anopheles marshallii]